MAGRLSTEEFEERLGRALEARFANDLTTLFTDLPGRRPRVAQEPQAPVAPVVSPPLHPAPTPTPAAPEPSKPWYAQWWMILVAVVVGGMTDGRLGFLVALTAVWIWVIYPRVVAPKRQIAQARAARPLTLSEREQVLYLVRTGAQSDAIALYCDYTGVDSATARRAVAAMGREIGR